MDKIVLDLVIWSQPPSVPMRCLGATCRCLWASWCQRFRTTFKQITGHEYDPDTIYVYIKIRGGINTSCYHPLLKDFNAVVMHVVDQGMIVNGRCESDHHIYQIYSSKGHYSSIYRWNIMTFMCFTTAEPFYVDYKKSDYNAWTFNAVYNRRVYEIAEILIRQLGWKPFVPFIGTCHAWRMILHRERVYSMGWSHIKGVLEPHVTLVTRRVATTMTTLKTPNTPGWSHFIEVPPAGGGMSKHVVVISGIRGCNYGPDQRLYIQYLIGNYRCTDIEFKQDLSFGPCDKAPDYETVSSLASKLPYGAMYWSREPALSMQLPNTHCIVKIQSSVKKLDLTIYVGLATQQYTIPHEINLRL